MLRRKQPSILASFAKIPRLDTQLQLPIAFLVELQEEALHPAPLREGPYNADDNDINSFVQAGQASITDKDHHVILTDCF